MHTASDMRKDFVVVFWLKTSFRLSYHGSYYHRKTTNIIIPFLYLYLIREEGASRGREARRGHT